VISCLRADDTILIKGSRAMGLERLVDAIREWTRQSLAKAEKKESKDKTAVHRRSAV
jgi:hypothetical protein